MELGTGGCLMVTALTGTSKPLSVDALQVMVNHHAQMPGRHSLQDYVLETIFQPGKDYAFFIMADLEAAERAKQGLDQFKIYGKVVYADVVPFHLLQSLLPSQKNEQTTPPQRGNSNTTMVARPISNQFAAPIQRKSPVPPPPVQQQLKHREQPAPQSGGWGLNAGTTIGQPKPVAVHLRTGESDKTGGWGSTSQEAQPPPAAETGGWGTTNEQQAQPKQDTTTGGTNTDVWGRAAQDNWDNGPSDSWAKKGKKITPVPPPAQHQQQPVKFREKPAPTSAPQSGGWGTTIEPPKPAETGGWGTSSQQAETKPAASTGGYGSTNEQVQPKQDTTTDTWGSTDDSWAKKGKKTAVPVKQEQKSTAISGFGDNQYENNNKIPAGGWGGGMDRGEGERKNTQSTYGDRPTYNNNPRNGNGGDANGRDRGRGGGGGYNGGGGGYNGGGDGYNCGGGGYNGGRQQRYEDNKSDSGSMVGSGFGGNRGGGRGDREGNNRAGGGFGQRGSSKDGGNNFGQNDGFRKSRDDFGKNDGFRKPREDFRVDRSGGGWNNVGEQRQKNDGSSGRERFDNGGFGGRGSGDKQSGFGANNRATTFGGNNRGGQGGNFGANRRGDHVQQQNAGADETDGSDGAQEEQQKTTGWGEPPKTSREFRPAANTHAEEESSCVVSKVILIPELPFETSRQEMLDLIVPITKGLLDINVQRFRQGINGQLPKVFALAEYGTLEEATRAIEQLKDCEFKGQKLMPKYSSKETINVTPAMVREYRQRKSNWEEASGGGSVHGSPPSATNGRAASTGKTEEKMNGEKMPQEREDTDEMNKEKGENGNIKEVNSEKTQAEHEKVNAMNSKDEQKVANGENAENSDDKVNIVDDVKSVQEEAKKLEAEQPKEGENPEDIVNNEETKEEDSVKVEQPKEKEELVAKDEQNKEVAVEDEQQDKKKEVTKQEKAETSKKGEEKEEMAKKDEEKETMATTEELKEKEEDVASGDNSSSGIATSTISDEEKSITEEEDEEEKTTPKKIVLVMSERKVVEEEKEPASTDAVLEQVDNANASGKEGPKMEDPQQHGDEAEFDTCSSEPGEYAENEVAEEEGGNKQPVEDETENVPPVY